MFSREEINQARASAETRRREEPHVVKAKFDAKLGRVILELSSGAWFAFRPEDVQGLGSATAAQLRQVEILPGNFAIDFPLLDVQFDLGALMQGRFGSKAWMAAHLGAAGGSVRAGASARATKEAGRIEPQTEPISRRLPAASLFG